MTRVLLDCDGQAALPGVLVDPAVAARRARNRATYQRRADDHLAKVYEWRDQNPERVAAHRKKWWKKNKARVTRERAAKRVAAYAANPRQWWLTETFRAARVRARREGFPFDHEIPDLVLPDICPVLGIEIFYYAKRGKHAPNSPSLDRIVPDLGYVASNLRVISNRANTLKNNATLDEMRRVLADMERLR
ncbi:MAG: hypothetical protein EHM89_00090 [Acidobacteria bacterium]|nr:MAG: hypothetical protein EHM89_00090 [Acidobacteriota bacterium]